KSEDLTHEALIKRAVSLVTNSANTYLSQTTLALVDTLTEYTKAVHTLISIQKRYVSLIGKLNPNEEEAIWQLIIRTRVEVNEKQEDCKRFESNWMNAVNLSERAAEAAYVAGADQASVFARNHLQMAQTQVEEVRQLSLKAERMLAEVQAEEIRSTAQQAETSKSAAGLEEEIPDAYLRED
ncbi:DBLOH protein, partial [Polyodon spathula]|nr:DBLOH protein [Polyodon spathula]